MVSVWLSKGVNDYHPPDFYIQIDSISKSVTFVNAVIENVPFSEELTTNDISYQNHLGNILVQTSAPYGAVMETSMIYIGNEDDKIIYVGLVSNITRISANVYRVDYAIDWYTSYLLTQYTYYWSNPRIPTAGRLLFRREDTGIFNYLDEGITPKRVSATKVNFTTMVGGAEVPMFYENDTYRLLVYRETESNTTHWIISAPSGGGSYPNKSEPQDIFDAYVEAENIRVNPVIDVTPTFNPKGVLFWGYLPVNIQMLDTVFISMPSGAEYQLWRLNDLLFHGTPGVGGILYSAPIRTGTKTVTITFPETLTSKDWQYYRFIDYDGNVVYELPRGVPLSGLSLTSVFNFIESAPYVAFYFNSAGVYTDGQFSFSIPMRTLSYFADSEQVYRAEERQYQKNMRNFQSMNELVSGVVGGVNQGAMISAFSRTQVNVGGEITSGRGFQPQPALAISKGLIGGGIGVAGAFATFGYQQLYANKRAQQIEDRRARVSADTLLMSGTSSVYGMAYIGLYEFYYDIDTTLAIDDYHSAFGYQSTRIDVNVPLNGLTGYVQADVIFDTQYPPLVEGYIKDMLDYGVKFNTI